MPERSFSIEFWARGADVSRAGAVGAAAPAGTFSEFFSYSAESGGDKQFLDDAIRIYRRAARAARRSAAAAAAPPPPPAPPLMSV